MNGAEVIIKTALAAGIKFCFSNPGTTELPLVNALDSIKGIRAVLGLFEGVCTGAADGYGRMADKPGMTLLHLGPGLSNGLANLHNAKRANTPIFNVIGEHASWHRAADAPLTMDIEALAKTVSGWQLTSESTSNLSKNTIDAISAAMKGQVSTLILPQDYQWSEVSGEIFPFPTKLDQEIDMSLIYEAARLLRSGRPSLLLLGGKALRKKGLQSAARISSATGCDLLSERVFARMERGPGIPSIGRIPYFPEHVLAVLSKYELILLAGAKEPVAFFGYKNMPSHLTKSSQQIFQIGCGDQDLSLVLEHLADALDAPELKAASFANHNHGDMPSGPLTAEKACVILARLQPEDAIIVDESVTSGAAYYSAGANAGYHTLLTLTGGAIGQGIPCSAGAALACPERPVINLQADGSAMYTLQALWTQARESLNVTTLICSNRNYNILALELTRAGQRSPGDNALSLLDLTKPSIDWVQISKGMGVPGVSVETADELTKELRQALKEPGPHLIELVL